MTAPQLAALPRLRTVFFFPVGPLEDHGPHLPMGLDLLDAHRLSEELAVRLEKDMPGWTGVLMPPAPLGIDSDTGPFAVRVRGHVLRDWLVDACLSLWARDFRHFACVSGHLGPKQLTAIEEAGRILRRRGGGLTRWFRKWESLPILVSASSPLVDNRDVRGSPLWPDPEEHGARRDTSLALEIERSIGEGLVDEGFVQLGPKPRPAKRWERVLRRARGQTEGYWGLRAPSEASPEQGKADLRDRADLLYPKLKAVWQGASPEALFRSWYSVIPSNGSFFRAWALALASLCLMLMWLFYSLSNLTQ